MNAKQKFWLTCWAIMGTVVSIVCISVALNTYFTHKAAFDHGYSQAPRVGTTSLMWSKDK
jgi:hypothetical protein